MLEAGDDGIKDGVEVACFVGDNYVGLVMMLLSMVLTLMLMFLKKNVLMT